MQIPFIGPTYNARSLNIDGQRSINWYPEVSPVDSKTVMSLVVTPGTNLFCKPVRPPVLWGWKQDFGGDTWIAGFGEGLPNTFVYALIYYGGVLFIQKRHWETCALVNTTNVILDIDPLDYLRFAGQDTTYFYVAGVRTNEQSTFVAKIDKETGVVSDVTVAVTDDTTEIVIKARLSSDGLYVYVISVSLDPLLNHHTYTIVKVIVATMAIGFTETISVAVANIYTALAATPAVYLTQRWVAPNARFHVRDLGNAPIGSSVAYDSEGEASTDGTNFYTLTNGFLKKILPNGTLGWSTASPFRTFGIAIINPIQYNQGGDNTGFYYDKFDVSPLLYKKASLVDGSVQWSITPYTDNIQTFGNSSLGNDYLFLWGPADISSHSIACRAYDKTNGALRYY